jgi:hypothetical protein
MINHVPEQYYMSCDACRELLCDPDNGNAIYEGSHKHIVQMAHEFGWKLRRGLSFCPKCYTKEG